MIEDPERIRAAIADGSIQRVLVLRAARVGDTLHVRPAIELLREALPDAFLAFVCSDYAHAAAARVPADLVVAWKHKGRGPAAIRARRQAERTLNEHGPFDLMIGLEDKPWGRDLAARLGVRFWHSESSAGEHLVERKAGVLAPLGLWDPSVTPPKIEWVATDEARERARALLASLPGPRIGVQAGSHAGRTLLAPKRRRDPSLEWLVDLGRALVERLGASVVVHAGLGGSERRSGRALVRRLEANGAAALFLEGLNLEDLSATIGELQAFVSANTGPAHLAAAQGVPLVLLDGPATPLTHPWRVEARLRVLNIGLECSPCRGTELSRHCFVPRCIDGIPADAVVAALREML